MHIALILSKHNHIDENNIGDEGAKFIVEAIENSNTFTTLYICKQPIFKITGYNINIPLLVNNNIGSEGKKILEKTKAEGRSGIFF